MTSTFFRCISSVWLSLAVISTSPLYANLVPNGSFEEIDNGTEVGWLVADRKEGGPIIESNTAVLQGVSISLDVGEAGIGSHSVKFEGEGTGDDYGVIQSKKFPIMPGFEYELAVRYKAEGLRQHSQDFKQYSALLVDFEMFNEESTQRVSGARILSTDNTRYWTRINMLNQICTDRVRIPATAKYGSVKVALASLYKSSSAVWVDEVSVMPLDPVLPNGGMEDGTGAGPEGWNTFGACKSAWDDEVAHGGKRSVSVSDASDAFFSGWSTIIPVRTDRSYVFNGYIKGGALNANSSVDGGALEIQFLDQEGQPLGDPVMSKPVGRDTDWTPASTPSAKPPVGAFMARLTAGLRHTTGTAWFDDLSLAVTSLESEKTARVKVQKPGPANEVKYAENLLVNGDVEAGEGDKPTGWTYEGSSATDWKPEEIEEFYTKGYPQFKMGRGLGEWSHETVYSGKGALLNICIDPPLSPRSQWYGSMPVDGYWLSDSMPCVAGENYIASAWLRPGNQIIEVWLGPLEIRFYDRKGNQIPAQGVVRMAMGRVPPGVWSYYATAPYLSPHGAVTMRLRFGRELSAGPGGWGRVYGDNFAVWQLPSAITPLTKDPAYPLNTSHYRDWFRSVCEKDKPPFLPSPEDAIAYENVWGRMINSAPGNLFYDPNAKVNAKFSLLNLWGESRTVSVKATCYDAWGEAGQPIEVKDIALKGGSENEVSIEIPPTGKYGSVYVDAVVMDGDAVVGNTSGRFAVMPPVDTLPEIGSSAKVGWTKGNPRLPVDAPASTGKTSDESADSVLAVTVLSQVVGDNRPYEAELGEMLKVAGFRKAWLPFFYSPDEASVNKAIETLRDQIAWYKKFGMQAIVRLGPQGKSPIDPKAYQAAGRLIGKALGKEVVAFGNWGVEQVNTNAYYRKDLTDLEFDTILAAQYDGIKHEAPNANVIVGNISTDPDAATLRRLYQAPASGKFDGSAINAYLAPLTIAENSLKEFDAHGDTKKTLWYEEWANQRSPFEGEARRTGEIVGAAEMVRSWVSMIGKVGDRLKSVTMWGFVAPTDADIMMVTSTLQPRPQFVAHSVLASFLHGATMAGDRSSGDFYIVEWSRPEGTLLIAWSNAGEKEIALNSPVGQVIVTDILGNSHVESSRAGSIKLKLSVNPVYISGGGKITLEK